MQSVSLKISVLLFLASQLVLLSSCSKPEPQPKPPTYLRLEVKKPVYITCDDKTLPFVFQYPQDCKLVSMESKQRDMRWLNLDCGKYGFEINISALELHSRKDLHKAINDCFTFLKRHEKLSGGIVQQDYIAPEKKVYGTMFEIKGRDVVSPCQFYLTDSSKHFVRFALNCKSIPNNDSLAPYIDRLKEDLKHLINTFSWR